MKFSHFSIEYIRADHIKLEDGYRDSFRLLPRPFASIAYVCSGGWEFCEYRHGREFLRGKASVGDLMYVPAGATYDSRWLGDPTAHAISIHFETTFIHTFNADRTNVQVIKREQLLPADSFEDFSRIAELLSKTSFTSPERLELMRRFYHILELISPLLTLSPEHPSDYTLLPAIEYLRENHTKPCTVDSLAQLCNLSTSHFYARFKRTLGLSPIDYKNSLSISNAERLLVDEPDLSIEEISERMGFSSSSYFRRVFKHMSGVSPREFRNSRGKLGLF